MSESSRSDIRTQILLRRARFVAAALAGAGVVGTTACREPQPCLSIEPVNSTETGTSAAQAAPDTQAAEPPRDASSSADAAATADGVAPTATTAAQAQDEPQDAGAAPPKICLRVAPPAESAPRPCLSMPKPCLAPPAPPREG